MDLENYTIESHKLDKTAVIKVSMHYELKESFAKIFTGYNNDEFFHSLNTSTQLFYGSHPLGMQGCNRTGLGTTNAHLALRLGLLPSEIIFVH